MAIRGRLQRDRRDRRAVVLESPAPLESRQLMAYTPLGFSLPDLTVSGYAGPTATYGGPIAVTVTVRNIGASSQVEPLALKPGSVSTADAGPFSVGVFLSKQPGLKKNSILLGDINFTAGLTQNNEQTVTREFTLPNRPGTYPKLGKDVFLTFVVDDKQQVRELDKTNNVSASVPVLLAPALPQLQAIGLELPPVMRAGDTIQASIEIANYGTVDTNLQAPVTVQLLASLDGTFGPGDTVISTFTIDNIRPVSVAPTQNLVLGDSGIDTPANVRIVTAPIATLPVSPATYFIGLRIDPNNQIRQISDLTKARSADLDLIQNVGPNTAGLPPAGVLSSSAPIANLFPIPAFGPLTTNNPVVVNNPNLYLTAVAAASPHRNLKAARVAQRRVVAQHQKTPSARAARRLSG